MPVTIMDLEPAAFISLDLFPASVQTGNVVIGEEFRAIVTDNYFYVLEEIGTGPSLKIKEPLVLFEGTNKTGYTVTTDKNVYSITRAANCGCGSRLRGVMPFPGVPHVSQLPK
jgi:hypothetical protein